MKAYSFQVLFREYFEGILAAIFLALFLRFFVLNVLYIPTDNMEPSLKRGDFVLGLRLAYGFPLPLMKGERLNSKSPERGDLVSLRFPGDEEQILVRRVIALEGDVVEVREGVVYVNGRQWQPPMGSAVDPETALPEGKMGQRPMDTMAKLKVPKDSFFSLSEKPGRADDSRDWGVVPLQNIESRIQWIWLSVDNSGEELSVRWERLFKRVH